MHVLICSQHIPNNVPTHCWDNEVVTKAFFQWYAVIPSDTMVSMVSDGLAIALRFATCNSIKQCLHGSAHHNCANLSRRVTPAAYASAAAVQA